MSCRCSRCRVYKVVYNLVKAINIRYSHRSINICLLYTSSVKAKIAVASINVETGDTFYYNGTDHVPTQSTIKFPLAIMIMRLVDSGKISLDEKFTLTKEELAIPGGKTLTEALHGGNSMKVHSLLEYMTHVSDNISFFGLTRRVGGGKKIEEYIKRTGLQGIGVAQRAGEPYVDFQNPYDTWCTPQDMAKLMVKFYKGELMSKTSTDTLRSIMERTTCLLYTSRCV